MLGGTFSRAGLTGTLAALACLLAPGTAGAATCNVPGTYATVQAAINDTSCNPIVIGPGTFNGSADPDRNLTIQGAGAGQTILLGSSSFTALDVTGGPGTTVSVSGLTVAHPAASTGSGIVVQTGNTLNLSDSIVRDNTNSSGGGVVVDGVGNLSRSSVVANTATGGGLAGAGVEVSGGGALQMTDSTISGNQATNAAGGYGAGLAITQTTSSLSLTNTTISGNSTKTFGGGFGVLDATSVSLTQVTIANNTADSDGNGTGDGGGIYIDSSAPVSVRDTIVANNIDPGGQAPDCFTVTPAYHLTRSGYVLLRNQSGCGLGGTGDDPTGYQTGVDPLLAPLADNGGPTQTMALGSGSPAIDAIPVGACGAATDQRGVSRPQGSGCDIGAFELVPPSPPDVTPPQTTLRKAKINRHKRSAKFKFSSDEAGSTFLCKLDRKPFKPCSSPKTYKHLKRGKHTFQVEAKDAAGNIDLTPARKKFRI